MAIYRWRVRSPFDELVRVQREMSRLVESYQNEQVPATQPPVNVYDDGERFMVRTEVAGLDKEGIDISVAGDVLTIKGTRAAESFEGSYHRRERGFGGFSRSLTLPDAIDVEQVEASYMNGLLEVTLPRALEARPRKISIEGN